jgi:lipid-A-disaccharide synthase
VASGTATLELACLNVPMVVAYRASFWTEIQFLIIKHRIRHIALPNILSAAEVVPELLGPAANPKQLAATLTPLLHDTPARNAQLDAFQRIRASLGEGNAVERTARLVYAVGSRSVLLAKI